MKKIKLFLLLIILNSSVDLKSVQNPYKYFTNTCLKNGVSKSALKGAWTAHVLNTIYVGMATQFIQANHQFRQQFISDNYLLFQISTAFLVGTFAKNIKDAAAISAGAMAGVGLGIASSLIIDKLYQSKDKQQNII